MRLFTRSSRSRWLRVVPAVGLVFTLCRPLLALRITEIMYNPREDQREFEYIELHNETYDPIDLTGFYFSRGIDFEFSRRTFLEPRGYLVVCANEDVIRAKYGITNTVGNWNPATALANGGETLEIVNSVGVVQTRVRFNDRGKWPGGADGTGHSIEIEDPHKEQDDPDNWSLSGVLEGSPGQENDTTAGKLPVVINEGVVVSPSGTPWVELYNKSLDEVSLAGFHLTTDPLNLTEAKLGDDLSIAPRGYVVLSLPDLGVKIGTDEEGKRFVGLVNATGDRVIDAFIFKPRLEGFSEARVPDGTRGFDDNADPTPGEPNRVGANNDIVINEIFYHHFDADPNREFVELYNRGAETVDLTGWRFNDGIDFALPPGTTIRPDSYLVVARDPVFVRQTYELSAAVVVGPQTVQALDDFGGLSNEGERITLVDEFDRVVDTVRWHDGNEWPVWPDGGGSSLELIDPFQDNSVGQAWDASDDSHKAEPKLFEYDGTYNTSEPELHLLLIQEGMALVDDIKVNTRTTTLETLQTFFDFGDDWKYFKGTEEPSDPQSAWREIGFPDDDWLVGPTPIGFGSSKDAATVLDDMFDNYGSVYFRKVFTLGELDSLESLILEIQYDDGFVAFLNGVEVGEANMRVGDEVNLNHDADALRGAPRDDIERIDLTDRLGTLVKPGENILAVQVHNLRVTSRDFVFQARLIEGRFVTDDGPDLMRDGTFETATPPSPNAWPPRDSNRNWLIQGNHIRSGRTEDGALSGSGSLKIVATGRGDNKVNRIETSNTGLSGLARGQNYVISFLAKWIVGSPTLLTHGNYSGGSAPSYAASHLLAIPENLGTPGRLNSATARRLEAAGSSNLGPVIWKLKQSPGLPGSLEPVRVEARVHDPDGVSFVLLRYTLSGRPPERDAPEVVSVPMVDPDGDGTYEGEIPGQALRRTVIYWIEAADELGGLGRYPVDHIQRAHPLLLDPENPSPNDYRYCLYRAENPSSTQSLSYRFFVHDANEDYLSTRMLLSNDLVDGTFIFDDRLVYHNSRTRFSGSPFARQRWSESYRIQLPDDETLMGRIGKFNMEDHQGAGGRDARERTSHYMIRFNQGGVKTPYSEQWLVQLQTNRVNGEIREHVETPSRELLERWFPDDDEGPFFEMDDRHDISDAGGRSGSTDAKWTYPPSPPTIAFGDDKEYYRYFFGSRGGNPYDDFSELIAGAKLMTTATTGNDEFDERVWEEMDVEAMLRVWAIRLNTSDWDTWGADRGKNCYLYHPPSHDLWVNIPWDMELTYETGRLTQFMPATISSTSQPDMSISGKFPDVRRFINRPAVKRLYYGIIWSMLDEPFNASFLTPYMQRLDQIRMASTNIGKPGGYVDRRRTNLFNATRGATFERMDFEVTTNGGEPLTVDRPGVTLEGRAPVEVKTIRVLVNGAAPPGEESAVAVFSDSETLGWSYTGTLPGGQSTVTFVAYDFDDLELASDSIEVTVSGNFFIRGDANLSGRLEILDPIAMVRFILGKYETTCEDAMDADDNGKIELTDPVLVLRSLFLSETPPPAPFPGRGEDPTDDALGCQKGL